MVDRIEEITQKIYNEGVIKAKDDADKIISDAKLKAEELIHSAKKMQQEIISEAEKQAGEVKQKTEAEIRLASKQFVSQLKQQITNIITTAQVDSTVNTAFNEVEFVQQIILKITDNWKPNDSENINLILLLPKDSEQEFTTFFNSKAIKKLNKGVNIQFDKKLTNGFKIGPQDGSYIISFTDKDFENYFKNYIKDKTRKLLFESENKE